MHHPIQMKPADSENRNGECHAKTDLLLQTVFIAIRREKNCCDASVNWLFFIIMHHHDEMLNWFNAF